VLPRLIQGGMGAGVSSWTLAREVSRLGQLGVVSGTALDSILVRKLWDGDVGGDARRAMAAFPSQTIVESVLGRYFRDGGAEGAAPVAIDEADEAETDEVASDEASGDVAATPGDPGQGLRYKLAPLLRAPLKPERNSLIVLANFVEVFLAK